MVKLITFLVGTAIAAFVGWLFWVPGLRFLLSLIPANAAYAWVGKLACVGLVGWFGGIAFPLFILFSTFAVVAKID